MSENGIRINKYLSEAGVCSRREADRLVDAGRVCIDGVTAVSGAKVCDGQTVTLDGRNIKKRKKKFILLLQTKGNRLHNGNGGKR